MTMAGKVRSEESKNKQSLAMRGRVRTEESKRKQSETMSGRTLTDEHKQKISDTQKLNAPKGENHYLFGMSRSEETKSKIAEARLGTTMTDESKQKISDKLKGRYIGDKHPRARTIQILGMTFTTIKEAHDKTGLTNYLIRKYWINKEEVPPQLMGKFESAIRKAKLCE